MSEKMTQKELKQPDAFQRAGLEAESWVHGKEKLVVAAVVALVALLGLYGLVDYFGNRSEQKAQQALGTALEPLTRPVSAEATARPGQPKPFATQNEKDEAIIASLAQFRSEKPSGNASATAALFTAQSQYRLGQFDEALKSYDAFFANAAKDAPLRAVALEGQGYAYEAKGDLEKALQSFESLAALQGNELLGGMGEYHKGRILVLQGKKDDAAKVFAEIPGKFPNTAAARMATERLNLLASQGVKVPPVAKPAPAAPDAAVGQAG